MAAAVRDRAQHPSPARLIFVADPDPLSTNLRTTESSTTKLLLRLFDPTEGHVLVDDKDIREYRSDDIRKATSVLWQDYQTFPLSVRTQALPPSRLTFPNPRRLF